jgi:hypothetical protein
MSEKKGDLKPEMLQPLVYETNATSVTPEELFEAAKPLMKLLNERFHPHCTIIVNQSFTEVLEGVCMTKNTTEFFVD